MKKLLLFIPVSLFLTACALDGATVDVDSVVNINRPFEVLMPDGSKVSFYGVESESDIEYVQFIDEDGVVYTYENEVKK